MTRNVSQTLAYWVRQVQFADFPPATVHKAKMHLLDTLGAALAGAGSDEVKKTLGLISPSGNSPIWGKNRYSTPRDAAFINGIAAHAYELDDCGGCDHSGAVVVPAILALLPSCTTKVSGEKLLVTLLMGYEVARRILEACGGYEVHNGLGWHSTGTCGVFGAAIAAGLTLGLDEAGLVSALGIAGSYAGGTWNFIHDGSQSKKLHAGRAAEGGVMAALMAQSGFQGSANILEAQSWGSYLATFGQGKGQVHALTEGFADNWRLNRCSIKPYATCRGTHSAIDALETICTEHGLDKNAIARIKVRISRFQADMCGGKVVTTRAQAQMSLAYALAAKLSYGQVFLAQLEEKAYRNSEVQSWIERTDIIIDDALPQEAEPEITVILHEGVRFSATALYPLGSPQKPLSDEKIIEKFTQLAAFSLNQARIYPLVEWILDLEKQSDVRHLPQLLV